MGHVPLLKIELHGDECLSLEDLLYEIKMPNSERLHSQRISIEYYPERRYASILAVEYKDGTKKSTTTGTV